MLERWRIGAIAAAVAVLAATSGTSFAAQKIGVAGAIKNEVQGLSGGAAEKLAPGSQLFEQEIVKTGAESLAQLIFLDETSLSVGPQAQVKLDKFVYDPNRKLGSVVLSATKGAFRFIDGRQDPRTYTIKTPVATIGMRGSTLDCYVFREGTFCIVEEGIANINGVIVRAGQAMLIRANGKSQGPFTPDGTLFKINGFVTFPLYGRDLNQLVGLFVLNPDPNTDIINQINATRLKHQEASPPPPLPPLPPQPPPPPCQGEGCGDFRR